MHKNQDEMPPRRRGEEEEGGGMGGGRREREERLSVVKVFSDMAFLSSSGPSSPPVLVDTSFTVLHGGSLVGISLLRLLHHHDAFCVQSIPSSLDASLHATSLRSPYPPSVPSSPLLTHAILLSLSPTSLSFFSRVFHLSLSSPLSSLVDPSSPPSVHQTCLLRARSPGPDSPEWTVEAVEVMPTTEGRGVVYWVRDEFSVILFDTPPSNERLPFRYVHAPNSVIDAGGMHKDDWYGRRVDFVACIDQPGGSDEFHDGHRYKAVSAVIDVHQPRTNMYRMHGVHSTRVAFDPSLPSVPHSTTANTTDTADSAVLNLGEDVLKEWRMVDKLARGETVANDVEAPSTHSLQEPLSPSPLEASGTTAVPSSTNTANIESNLWASFDVPDKSRGGFGHPRTEDDDEDLRKAMAESMKTTTSKTVEEREAEELEMALRLSMSEQPELLEQKQFEEALMISQRDMQMPDQQVDIGSTLLTVNDRETTPIASWWPEITTPAARSNSPVNDESDCTTATTGDELSLLDEQQAIQRALLLSRKEAMDAGIALDESFVAEPVSPDSIEETEVKTLMDEPLVPIKASAPIAPTSAPELHSSLLQRQLDEFMLSPTPSKTMKPKTSTADLFSNGDGGALPLPTIIPTVSTIGGQEVEERSTVELIDDCEDYTNTMMPSITAVHDDQMKAKQSGGDASAQRNAPIDLKGVQEEWDTKLSKSVHLQDVVTKMVKATTGAEVPDLRAYIEQRAMEQNNRGQQSDGQESNSAVDF